MPDSHAPVRHVLLTSVHENGFGGVQVLLRDLVRSLEQNGRQVSFVYDAALPSIRMVETVNGLGCRSFHCPMPVIFRNSSFLSALLFFAYLPITFFQLWRVIRRHQIDVINCHYLTPYFLHLVIAGRLLRVPVIVSVHGADVDAYAQSTPVRRFVFRLIMRGADRIVACSEAFARQTKEVFPQAAFKVTYVHNGLDPSRYRFARQPLDLLKPYLLAVSRQVQKKGIDTLLHAFVAIRREFPKLGLALVGGGPLLETHKALAHALGISVAVAFMGDVPHDEVSRYFHDCKLFVLPSRAEPFGLVVLEAAYHQKGVVCTRVGGVPEIIADDQNGLLVEPDDPSRLAAKVIELLRDPERAEALGAAAYETVMTRFLWKDRIHDYIAVYEGRRDDSPVAFAAAASTASRQAAPAPKIG